MLSTLPRRFLPISVPLNHKIRVKIQSRSVNCAISSGVQISPVGLRPTNTVFACAPAPILARMICAPNGVQPLSFSQPTPLAAVETGYLDLTLPKSSKRVRVWCEIEISMRINYLGNSLITSTICCVCTLTVHTLASRSITCSL